MARTKTPKGTKPPMGDKELAELETELARIVTTTRDLAFHAEIGDWPEVQRRLCMLHAMQGASAEWCLAWATRINAYLVAAGLPIPAPVTAKDLES